MKKHILKDLHMAYVVTRTETGEKLVLLFTMWRHRNVQFVSKDFVEKRPIL